MVKTELTTKLKAYLLYLKQSEKSISTCKQYCRDIEHFLIWLGNKQLIKDKVILYKDMLIKEYCPASVNTKLAAVNGFLDFLGAPECRVKQLKIQRQAYCSSEKELTKQEYIRMLRLAKTQGNERLVLLLQTVCSTGIRVSELQYITAEAVRAGEAVVRLKGKTRTILIAGKLRKVLKSYMRRNQFWTGPIFVTKNGKPLDRSNIWRMLKELGRKAGVKETKVFPHNLRHLFARCFYAIDKDIAKLADILGHSSIDTTRIYILSSGREHRERMEKLGLVI